VTPAVWDVDDLHSAASQGGKLGGDLELRFALRSLERHWKGEFRVAIVGRKVPEWAQGVEHVAGEGLKSSLAAAAQAYPEGSFWFYDDCCVLQAVCSMDMALALGSAN